MCVCECNSNNQLNTEKLDPKKGWKNAAKSGMMQIKRHSNSFQHIYDDFWRKKWLKNALVLTPGLVKESLDYSL